MECLSVAVAMNGIQIPRSHLNSLVTAHHIERTSKLQTPNLFPETSPPRAPISILPSFLVLVALQRQHLGQLNIWLIRLVLSILSLLALASCVLIQMASLDARSELE